MNTLDDPDAVGNDVRRFLSSDAFLGALSAAIVIFTYLPVLFGRYAFLDDYAFLRAAQLRDWNFFNLVVAAGRPLSALALSSGFATAGTLDNLWGLRALTLLGFGLSVTCMYHAFRLGGHRRYPAAAVSAVMFLLPPFQVYAAWAQYFIAGPAILFAYLSFRSALQSRLETRTRRKLLYCFIAIALLTLSTGFYQSLAMTFWVFGVITLTGPAPKAGVDRQSVFLLGIVGTVGMAAGYVVFRVAQAFFPSAGARYQVTAQPFEKFEWFFSEALRRAMALNLLNAGVTLSIAIGVIVAVGIWFYCRTESRSGLGSLLLLLLCVPLSYAPSLLTGENWASSRSMGALSLCVAYLAFLSLAGFRRLIAQRWGGGKSEAMLAAVACVWLFGSAYLATRNVTVCFVIPQERELAYIKARLTAPEFAAGRKLVFVKGHWSITAATVVLYDEFGLSSSAVSYTVRPIVELLLNQIRPSQAIADVRFVEFGVNPNPAPDEYVVDMKDLAALR